EEIVPLLGRHLRCRGGVDGGNADVIDDDVGIVLLAPFLDVLVVEPLVVTRHEVVPLQDLQRLARGAAPARQQQPRRSVSPCRLDDFAPGEPPVSHELLLRSGLLQGGAAVRHLRRGPKTRALALWSVKATGSGPPAADDW